MKKGKIISLISGALLIATLFCNNKSPLVFDAHATDTAATEQNIPITLSIETVDGYSTEVAFPDENLKLVVLYQSSNGAISQVGSTITITDRINYVELNGEYNYSSYDNIVSDEQNNVLYYYLNQNYGESYLLDYLDENSYSYSSSASFGGFYSSSELLYYYELPSSYTTLDGGSDEYLQGSKVYSYTTASTIYAVITEKAVCDITYDLNGGLLNGTAYDSITLQYISGVSSETPVTVNQLGLSLSKWVNTSKNISISSGSLYSFTESMELTAVYETDTTAPTISNLSVINNYQSGNTVSVTMQDTYGISGYYFGTSNNPSDNQYISIAGSPTSYTINTLSATDAGTYYIFAKDSSGNVSAEKTIIFASVTFDMETGSSSDNITAILADGYNVGTLPTTSKTNYTFEGWASDTSSINNIISSSTKVELSDSSYAITYSPIWGYTITYNALVNGGQKSVSDSSSTWTQKAYYGITTIEDINNVTAYKSTISSSSNVYADAIWSYIGWNTSSGVSTTISDIELITDNVTNGSVVLYAVYRQNIYIYEYTLSSITQDTSQKNILVLDTSENTKKTTIYSLYNNETSIKITLSEGSNLNKSESFIDYFIFKGWYTSSSVSNITSKNLTSAGTEIVVNTDSYGATPIEYYAVYSYDYTITYMDNIGSGTEETKSITYEYLIGSAGSETIKNPSITLEDSALFSRAYYSIDYWLDDYRISADDIADANWVFHIRDYSTQEDVMSGYDVDDKYGATNIVIYCYVDNELKETVNYWTAAQLPTSIGGTAGTTGAVYCPHIDGAYFNYFTTTVSVNSSGTKSTITSYDIVTYGCGIYPDLDTGIYYSSTANRNEIIYVYAYYDSADYASYVYEVSETYYLDGEQSNTLYAHWKTSDAEIKFNTSYISTDYGVENFILSGTVASAEYGSTITEPYISVNNYTIEGWYQTRTLIDGEVTYSDKWDFSTDTISGSLTLYPCFEPYEYQIEFNANGGAFEIATYSEDSATYSQTILFNETISNTPIVTKEGYTFAGWFPSSVYDMYGTDDFTTLGYSDYEYKDGKTASLINSTSTIEIMDGIVYFAVWTANPADYTIKYYFQDYNGEYDDSEYSDGESSDFIIEVPDSWYAYSTITVTPKLFDGFTCETDEKTVTINPDGSTVVEFFYVRQTYTARISTSNADYGISGVAIGTTVGTNSSSSAVIGQGAPLTVTIRISSGYNFSGLTTTTKDSDGNLINIDELNSGKYTSDGNDTIYTASMTMPISSIDLYASSSSGTVSYTVNEYIQNVSGTGYTNVSTTSYTTAAGTTLTPTITTRVGFTTPTVSEVAIVTNGQVIDYYYTRNTYYVSYKYDPGSNVSASDSFGYYYYGALFELNASVNTGRTWLYWTVNDAAITETSTDGVVTYPTATSINIPAYDIELSAVTESITYSIEFNSNVPENSSLSSTSVAIDAITGIDYEDTITLPENTFAIDGYVFSHWSTSSTGYENNVELDSYYSGKTVNGLSSVDGDVVTLYAIWVIDSNTKYTVIHLYEDLNGAYTEIEEEIYYGVSGDSVTPSVKLVTGFTSPSTQTQTIAANGSLKIYYYYTRNEYTLSINKTSGVNITAYVNGTAVINNNEYVEVLSYDETSDDKISNDNILSIECKYGSEITISSTTEEAVVWEGWLFNRYVTIVTENSTESTLYVEDQEVTFYMVANDVIITPRTAGAVFTVTLDSKFSDSKGNTITPSTEGTVIIYQKYGEGWYLDSLEQYKITAYYESEDSDPTGISIPVLSGYTFDGYYTEESGEGTKVISSSGYLLYDGLSSTVFSESGAILYANYLANTYEVSFDVNGNLPENEPVSSSGTGSIYFTYDSHWARDEYGSQAMTSAKYPITLPYSTNYVFDGYYTKPNGEGTKIITSSGYLVSDNVGQDEITAAIAEQLNSSDSDGSAAITLYANWVGDVYKISLDSISATSKGTESIYVKYSDSWYLDEDALKEMTSETNEITIPTKTNLFFFGYYTNINGNGVQIINENGYITQSASNIVSTYQMDSTIYALWKYKITLNLNGGTGVESVYGIDGFSATEPAEPTKEGLTFDDWYTVDGYVDASWDNDYIYEWDTTHTSNMDDGVYNLYAKWNATVTFDTTEGGSLILAQTITENDYAIRPSDPIKEDCEFVGWYTDETYTTEFNFNSPITKDTTIYAKWDVLKQYTTISYNSGEVGSGLHVSIVLYTVNDETEVSRGVLFVSGVGSMYDFEYSYVQSLQNTNLATLDGYNLPPWYEYRELITSVVIGSDVQYIGRNAFAGMSNLKTIDLTANENITAGQGAFGTSFSHIWGEQYSAENHDPTTNSVIYVVGDTAKELLLESKAYDENYTYVITKHKFTLVAFTGIESVYIIDAYGNNVGTTGYYYEGETINISATVYTGYRWSSWTLWNLTPMYTPMDTTLTMPDSDYLLMGTSSNEDYKVYFSANDTEGTGTVSLNGTEYNTTENQIIDSKQVIYSETYGELPEPTRNGYEFIGWYTKSTGGTEVNEATLVTYAGDHTLYAHWEALTDTTYTVVKYLMDTNGTDYTEVKIYEIREGTTDLPTVVIPEDVIGFQTPAAQVIAPDGDGTTIVTYYYERLTYQLAVLSDSTSSVYNMTGGGTYFYGEKVTVSASVYPGYEFNYWISSANSNSDEMYLADGPTGSITYTFTMPNVDASLTASILADTDTKYTVIHMEQNTDGGYDEVKVETLTGTTGSTVSPAPTQYGDSDYLYTPDTQSAVILGDGSTVITYYYLRKQFTLTIEEEEGFFYTGSAGGTYYAGSEIKLSGYFSNTMTDANGNVGSAYSWTSDSTIGDNGMSSWDSEDETLIITRNSTWGTADKYAQTTSFTMPVGNVTIDPEVYEHQYTITYNDNIGTLNSGAYLEDSSGNKDEDLSHTTITELYEYNEELTLRSSMYDMYGYVFTGWSLTKYSENSVLYSTDDIANGILLSELGGLSDVSSYTNGNGHESVTLYAQWEVITIAVTYDFSTNGGWATSSGESSQTLYVDCFETIPYETGTLIAGTGYNSLFETSEGSSIKGYLMELSSGSKSSSIFKGFSTSTNSYYTGGVNIIPNLAQESVALADDYYTAKSIIIDANDNLIAGEEDMTLYAQYMSYIKIDYVSADNEEGDDSGSAYEDLLVYYFWNLNTSGTANIISDINALYPDNTISFLNASLYSDNSDGQWSISSYSEINPSSDKQIVSDITTESYSDALYKYDSSTGYFTINPMANSGSITLSAVYTRDITLSYKMETDAVYGTTPTQISPQTYKQTVYRTDTEDDYSITLNESVYISYTTEDVTYTGYIFLGWSVYAADVDYDIVTANMKNHLQTTVIDYSSNNIYTDYETNSEGSILITDILQDSIAYAKWQLDVYTLTLSTTNRSAGQEVKTTLVPVGATVIDSDGVLQITGTGIDTEDDYGWEFLGWSKTSTATSASTDIKMGTGDMTLYAIYSRTISYTIGAMTTISTGSVTAYNGSDTTIATSSIKTDCSYTLSAIYYGKSATSGTNYANENYPLSATKTYKNEDGVSNSLYFTRAYSVSYTVTFKGYKTSSTSSTKTAVCTYVYNYAKTKIGSTTGSVTAPASSLVSVSGMSFSGFATSSSATKYSAGSTISGITSTVTYTAYYYTSLTTIPTGQIAGDGTWSNVDSGSSSISGTTLTWYTNTTLAHSYYGTYAYGTVNNYDNTGTVTYKCGGSTIGSSTWGNVNISGKTPGTSNKTQTLSYNGGSGTSACTSETKLWGKSNITL